MEEIREVRREAAAQAVRGLEAVRQGVERPSRSAVYDLLIRESARRASAAALLTLNPRHFERFNPEPIVIVVPGA